jgi:hypothetical protein
VRDGKRALEMAMSFEQTLAGDRSNYAMALAERNFTKAAELQREIICLRTAGIAINSSLPRTLPLTFGMNPSVTVGQLGSVFRPRSPALRLPDDDVVKQPLKLQLPHAINYDQRTNICAMKDGHLYVFTTCPQYDRC